MNKEIMTLIIETAKKITDKGHLEDTLEAAVLLLATPIVDIARQLTIANEIAVMRGTNELRAQSGMAVAYTEKHFDVIVDGPTIPTPDALVEACKKLIRNADNDEDIEAISDMSGWTKSIWVTRKDLTAIESILAAHKKAGG